MGDFGAGPSSLRVSLQYSPVLAFLYGDLNYQVSAKGSSKEIQNVGGVVYR